MDDEDKRRVLAEKLDAYRKWSYEALVAELEREGSEHDCLEHFEGVFRDGAEYQIELNVFRDGPSGDDVRVMGSLDSSPQLPIPGTDVYRSDVCDSFIMRPDGTFVGE